MTAGCKPCSIMPCWIIAAALRHFPLRRTTRPVSGQKDFFAAFLTDSSKT